MRPRLGMPPTAKRVDSRYPGVARKTSPGTTVIERPVTASTIIGDVSGANLNAQTQPSKPGAWANLRLPNGGTRRRTDVLLTLAGSGPPFIARVVATRAASFFRFLWT